MLYRQGGGGGGVVSDGVVMIRIQQRGGQEGGVSYMGKQITRFLEHGLKVKLYLLLSLMQIREKRAFPHVH